MEERKKELNQFVQKIIKEAVEKNCTVEEVNYVFDKLKEDGRKLKLTF